jgi:hypothetical protein
MTTSSRKMQATAGGSKRHIVEEWSSLAKAVKILLAVCGSSTCPH